MREERALPAAAIPPRANPLLLGHGRAEAQVRRWIDEGRLGHALLICGPWGIGKATWAFRIARSLLRLGTGTADGGIRAVEVGQGEQQDLLWTPARVATAPEASSSTEVEDQIFRWVASAAHPDLLTVERRFDEKRGRQLTEIVVEDVRKIGTFLASSAARGGWRVVVVDAADEMNRNAANALLKVLEEPGAKSLIILVAHQPGLLPATVRSRCRRVVLRPLDNDVLDRLIVRYQPEVSDPDRTILTTLAEGSIGCALDLATADGLKAWRTLATMFAALADGDDRPLLAYASDPPSSDADGFRVTAHLLSWWLRTLARAAAAGPGDPFSLAVPPVPGLGEGAVIVRRLAAAGTLDRWLKVWDKTHRLIGQAAAGNLDRKQALTTVLLDMRCEVWAATD